MRSVVNTFTWLEFERIKWAYNFIGFNIEHVKVDHCRADIAVSKQFLNGSDIGSSFQQMCREAVPESMRGNPFVEAEFGYSSGEIGGECIAMKVMSL